MENILILGKEYPIEYTVEAQAKVIEKAGDIQKISEVIQNNPCFLISVMMEAAQHRNAVFAMINGKESEAGKLLTEEELKTVLTPVEQRAAMTIAMEVVTKALKSDVETAHETGKKTKKSIEQK